MLLLLCVLLPLRCCSVLQVLHDLPLLLLLCACCCCWDGETKTRLFLADDQAHLRHTATSTIMFQL
jgi:hypothetical protein